MSFLGAFNIEVGDILGVQTKEEDYMHFEVTGFRYDSPTWGAKPDILLSGLVLSSAFTGKTKMVSIDVPVRDITGVELVKKRKGRRKN